MRSLAPRSPRARLLIVVALVEARAGAAGELLVEGHDAVLAVLVVDARHVGDGILGRVPELGLGLGGELGDGLGGVALLGLLGVARRLPIRCRTPRLRSLLPRGSTAMFASELRFPKSEDKGERSAPEGEESGGSTRGGAATARVSPEFVIRSPPYPFL